MDVQYETTIHVGSLFMTKTAENPYPLFGAAHTYIAHIRE